MPTRESDQRRSARTENRQRRDVVASPLAERYGGVVRRADLLRAGLTYGDIRVEIEAGRWHRLGRYTVGITVREATGVALWHLSCWETGSRAVLDGASALQAAGLQGWVVPQVVVSVPKDARARRVDGVQLHRPRRQGPVMRSGVPRVRPEVAAVNALLWASTARSGATLAAMAVQQRIVAPDRFLREWRSRTDTPALLGDVVGDICDGAHSLGELDFAALCRGRGLPEPSRQVVRQGPRARCYLDVEWADLGVHVEINGVQHYVGTAIVDDALRANAVILAGGTSLAIPVLGLRLAPSPFLDQVEHALAMASQLPRA